MSDVSDASDVSGESAVSPALSTPCPNCGEPVSTGDAFCEACGTTLIVPAAAAAPPAAGSEGPTACLHCGGAIADDGYCEHSTLILWLINKGDAVLSFLIFFDGLILALNVVLVYFKTSRN